jgi:ABC-type sulfate/molybdate transport systems ATPase subunit
MELAFLTAPRSGSVLFNGQDPNAQKGRFASMRRPREVAVLVQNAEDNFARTVADDVAFVFDIAICDRSRCVSELTPR